MSTVIVGGEGITRFLAGDATCSQANLLAGKTDGVTDDPEGPARLAAGAGLA